MTNARVALVAVLATLALAGAAGAGDDYDCGYLTADGCRESAPVAAGPAAPSCRLDLEAVFWTGTDWERIARAMAADRTPCGEYWVSIPPTAADKKRLRFLQDDLVRGLGVHPMFEMTLGELTGWVNDYVDKGHSWFEAGVEFRRRMRDAGMSGPDETWLLNEFDATTMRDGPRGTPDHPWPAFPRDGVAAVLEGLYYGELGMAPLPGLVEIGIHFRHQNIPDVAAYKEQAKAWLEDDRFWARVAPTIRWLGVETYPDVRLWGVPGSSRAERRRHTEDYVFHLLDLVRDAPGAEAARTLFERTYLPFVNSGYRANGGDLCTAGGGPFVSCHGNTFVDAVTMQHFVSEQVHAVRHYAGAHPGGSPDARIGFSWQPCNRLVPNGPCEAVAVRGFAADLDAIAARMAESLHHAYRQGGASQMGACFVPGSGEDWCEGEVPGAVFTEEWSAFRSWD